MKISERISDALKAFGARQEKGSGYVRLGSEPKLVKSKLICITIDNY